jgi:ABC-type multidrug transport system fused ATPase/permease subunit
LNEESSFWSRLRTLGPYVRRHRKPLALSSVLSVLSTAMGMIQPYFAKLLIDDVFLAGAYEKLAPFLGGLVLLLLLGFAIRVTNNYIYTLYSARLLFRMREDLLAHLQRVPLNFFSRNRMGDIYSRMASDMADIQQMCTDTIPVLFFNFLTFVITAGILLWLNWQMALMSLGFLPIGLIAVYRLRPRLTALAREVAENNADISHFLFESLSGTLVVRAFGAENLECRRLREKHGRVLRNLLSYQFLGALSGLAPTLFVILNTLVVFGFGGYSLLRGTLSVGGLVAFSIYQGRVFAVLQGLMDGFLTLQKSRVSLKRVREILDIPTTDGDGGNLVIEEEDLRGEIAFEDVSFSHEPGEPTLRHLSFNIPAGRMTALVGPSGAGKSTICHLILGLLKPDSGRITLDGVELDHLRRDWLRRRIALVSQDTFLFHTSILENIRFSRPDASDDEVTEAARAACIHEFIVSLPRGYHTEVGDRGVRLSGGQKQRVSIARTILLKPRILLLDEATAFLDASAEERLKETMTTLMEGRTILVVSHRLSTLRGAEKVIAIDANGHLCEGGLETMDGESEVDCQVA